MTDTFAQKVRRFLGVSNNIRLDKTWHNWGNNYQCKPDNYFEPKSVDDLISIVNKAREAKKGIRMLGAGHSWSDIVCTNDFLVSLKSINKIIKIDKANKTVTVEAGIKVGELVDRIDEKGLAFFNIGEVDAQQVGGVIATATHGSGMTGSFSSMVLSVKLLLSSGEIIKISETENAQYFEAVKTNLGCLGIVVEATLALRETYNVIKHQEIHKTKEAIENTHSFLSKPTSKNKTCYFPYATKHIFSSYEEEIASPTIIDKLRNPFIASLDRIMLAIILNFVRLVPISLKPNALSLLLAGVNTNLYQLGKWFQILEFAHNPIFKIVLGHVESEIAIPKENVNKVIEELFSLMEEKKIKINGYILARTVEKETSWLSPAYDRDTVYITFAHIPSRKEDWKKTYLEIETFMIEKHQGRPHWGKINLTDQQFAKKSYPKYDDFAKVRKELDSIGMFANDYIRRFFTVD